MMIKRQRKRSMLWPKPVVTERTVSGNGKVAAPLPSAGRAVAVGRAARGAGHHTLADLVTNACLRDYEVESKARFDRIETVLGEISRRQGTVNFLESARDRVREELGIELPESLLKNTWIGGLDIKALYAYCLFAVFENFSKAFFEKDPLDGMQTEEFDSKLHALGYHAVGVAPCADGRLAHVVSYVLRLPWSRVRRKAHAGVMFDVSESVRNWVFVEHRRYRSGEPVPASEPTRYLKIAVYHFSVSDPHHQGCAAHGSDDAAAARAAAGRLKDFKAAIENRFCCGATIDTLLIGMNTDDDSLRIHLEDADGEILLDRFVDTGFLYQLTLGMEADVARQTIRQQILEVGAKHWGRVPAGGKLGMVEWLIENNLSQIDYVKTYVRGKYPDVGHAERFIGVGAGFGEVQLRNLSYYVFLDTLEEGAADVDVGIKIFKGLNVSRGLPVPIVIRCDYDSRVPGSRDRAEAKARRINDAILARYESLADDGLLATMATLNDVASLEPPERIETTPSEGGGH